MGLFTSLKSLFTTTEQQPQTKQYESCDYKGFEITPSPIAEKGQYRVAAFIRKTIQDDAKEHHFIRSDVCPSEQQAIELAIQKCQVFIDQLGEDIFQ
ncbi:HlyU family transcriptional regulator [Celerinatantimonas sp. YJH-8]|uniref:HlyU family transcriptional regulator n=1 Tax=Celerinatantimonas sp. YJH-8 TaxID=3228714 RepID=UPI0038CB9B5F